MPEVGGLNHRDERRAVCGAWGRQQLSGVCDTPLQVTARLPADDQIFRVGEARLDVDPQDARAQLALCCTVSEEELRFGRCLRLEAG